MDNRLAAAQLATVLLAVVAVLLQLEQRAQKRMRFNQGRGARQGSSESQPLALHGIRRVLAWSVCGLPVLLGFVLPVWIMLRAFLGETSELPWERFGQWAWTSFRLGVITAVLAVGVDRHAMPELDLRFAVADARGVAGAHPQRQRDRAQRVRADADLFEDHLSLPAGHIELVARNVDPLAQPLGEQLVHVGLEAARRDLEEWRGGDVEVRHLLTCT
jgi:hypothetical protein